MPALKVNNFEIESKNSVKLLGIEVDEKLLFDKHIVSLWEKVANQLQAICRLQNQMDKTESEKHLLIVLFTQTLTTAHFCGIFFLKN